MSQNQKLQSEQTEKEKGRLEKLGVLRERIRPLLIELSQLSTEGHVKPHIEIAIKELEAAWQLAGVLTDEKTDQEHFSAEKQELTNYEPLKTLHRQPQDVVSLGSKDLEYFLKETSAIAYKASHIPPYGITFVSENVRTITGYAAVEFVNDIGFWASHLHPKDSDLAFENFKKVLEGESGNFEYRFRFKDGTYHWIYDQRRFTYDEQGKVNGFIGSWTDITQKKETEGQGLKLLLEAERLNEELVATEQFAQQIIANAQEAIAVFDTKLRFVVWNPFAEKIFRMPAEKVLGKNPLELFSEVFNKEPERYHQIERALRGKTEIYRDLYVPVSETDGEWLTGIHSPLKNSQGDIIGVLSIGTVITDRKAAERALFQQKNLLQAFYDSSHFSMCVFELTVNDFIYQLPNKALAEFFNLSVEEMTGKTAGELKLFSPEAICHWFDLFKNCVETERTVTMEYPLSRKDGHVEWHFGSFSPIGPNTIALISTEITERKRAEEENIRLLKETQKLNQELQASQLKLQEAQKIARLGNWELDVLSNKMDWSEELFRMFGLDRSHGVPDFDTYMQLIWPEFRKEFQRAVAESIESGKEYELEVKIKAADVPFRWCMGMGRPVLNSKGEVVKVMGIWYDITERKKAEEQVKDLLRSTQEMYDHVLSGEEELRQSLEKTLELNEKILESEERLRHQNDDLRKINSELDNFVYRTSHDLRSPLVSILGLINISRIEEDQSKKAEYLTLIEKSITRLDTFISDIINYSRNSRLEIVKSEINFQVIMKETLDGLRFLDGFDTIEIKIHINQVVSFFSDLVRVKMICNNMISNAIKYRSTLTTRSQIHIWVEVEEEKAVLVFQDNGIGIKEENLEKIFDMFYRASASGAGSGLGLYIVKDVVNTLNGSIKVQSQVGKGTTFTVEIPNLRAEKHQRVLK